MRGAGESAVHRQGIRPPGGEEGDEYLDGGPPAVCTDGGSAGRLGRARGGASPISEYIGFFSGDGVVRVDEFEGSAGEAISPGGREDKSPRATTEG